MESAAVPAARVAGGADGDAGLFSTGGWVSFTAQLFRPASKVAYRSPPCKKSLLPVMTSGIWPGRM